MMLSKEYIAGYFDGEGCVLLSKKGWITCRIRSAYRSTLEEIHAQYGGYICVEKKTHIHRKQLWSWTIATRQAERFLRDIEPILQEKKEQVRIVLAYQVGRNTTSGKSLTDADREFLERTRQSLMEARKQQLAV
jgi:hypothetical protein